MENKKLFRILSLIPEEVVESYRVEFINRLAPVNPNAPLSGQPRFSAEILSVYDLFIEYFQKHIELTYCKVALKEGGSIEFDCLGGMLFIKAGITFPFLDKLIALKLLGADAPLNSIRFI